MYLWLETTFGTVQKWSLRPLLDSPKGGLNIGILLYLLSCAPRSFWKKNEFAALRIRSKFCLFYADLNQQGMKNIFDEVSCLASVSFLLNLSGTAPIIREANILERIASPA